MNINKKRLQENLLRVGEIGRISGGGITRLAFSREFKTAAKTVQEMMKEAGLEVQSDRIGNIFGRRRGKKDSLPAIMVGSHLDTVRNGGLFDGNLGIISALECIHALNEAGMITEHPLEIAAFNAEEGGEMGGTFGSRVAFGLQDPAEKGLAEKLAQYTLNPDDVRCSIRNIEAIGAFLELHIEQGNKLYASDVSIGIVDAVVGITRYRIKVAGEANHAGTTAMAVRKDALMAAAELLIEIERIAVSLGEPFVATVGVLAVFPGAVSIIPGQVEFILELRDKNPKNIETFMAELQSLAAKTRKARVEYELLIDKPPATMDRGIREILRKSCLNKKIPCQVMTSGAGHDAKEIARKIPAGMIFVPSKDGKSHCPEEWTAWEDVYRGTEVLLEAITLLDKASSVFKTGCASGDQAEVII